MKNNVNIHGDNYGGIHNYFRRPTNPSFLAEAVNEISKFPVDLETDTAPVVPFDIQAKIDLNQLIEFKHVIENYPAYAGWVNDAYTIVSSTKPNCRDKIMRLINKLYLAKRDQLIVNVESQNFTEVIAKNSDTIMRAVVLALKEKLYESINLDATIHTEDIEDAIHMIVSDAFISCKILENPTLQ